VTRDRESAPPPDALPRLAMPVIDIRPSGPAEPTL